MSKKMYVVTTGKYKGRKGTIGLVNEQTNLVMFYPIEGHCPYRVCLGKDEVKEI